MWEVKKPAPPPSRDLNQHLGPGPVETDTSTESVDAWREKGTSEFSDMAAGRVWSTSVPPWSNSRKSTPTSSFLNAGNIEHVSKTLSFPAGLFFCRFFGRAFTLASKKRLPMQFCFFLILQFPRQSALTNAELRHVIIVYIHANSAINEGFQGPNGETKTACKQGKGVS